MRAVNLLPNDSAQGGLRGKPGTPPLVGACVGVLVAALLAAAFMMQSGKVAAAQNDRDAKRAELASTPEPPAGPSVGQQQLVGEHSARVAALSAAMSSRVAWDRVFREFSLVLPEDVWLTTLAVKSPVSPATALPTTGTTPSGFTISGRTYSHDGVARLLSRLQVVPDLTNVQLVSSTLSELKGQDIVEFSIAADIKTPPVTATTGVPSS